MSELDEAWGVALAEAEKRARVAGRSDVAAYLALRNSNDLLRTTATDWLLNTFMALVAEANRSGASIRISRNDTHRFRVGSSTMVGSSLTMSLRVRSLVVEAGWPRTPSDGFIRGGGLARAQIRHLGIRNANQDLLLVRSDVKSPQWLIKDKPGVVNASQTALQRHIRILCDQA